MKFPPARLASVFPALLAGLFLILSANNAWAKPVSIGGAVLCVLQWKMCRAEMTTGRVTPLMKAAKEGNAEKVQELLAAGADVNAQDERGLTPLMWAAGNSFQNTVQILLNAGADIDIKNNKGRTALDLTRNSDEIKELLRKAQEKMTNK